MQKRRIIKELVSVSQPQMILNLIESVQSQPSLKRNEENMKFIFKFIIKEIQDSLDLK